MRIGELARRTGASTRSLRHYEQRGLITANRDHHGHRRYDEEVVHAVGNVRDLLASGLTIDDIQRFGTCVRAPDLHAHPCAEALDVHERRLRALEARISALDHLRADLARRTAALREHLAAPSPGSSRRRSATARARG